MLRLAYFAVAEGAAVGVAHVAPVTMWGLAGLGAAIIAAVIASSFISHIPE